MDCTKKQCYHSKPIITRNKFSPFNSFVPSSPSEVETSAGEEQDEEDDEQHISDSSSSSEREDEPKLDPVKSAFVKQDSGSETDSDSESEPAEAKPKKKESPAVKSGKKRASEGTSSKDGKDQDVKRAKKVSGDDENKKTYFERLWSEEDEICLLQGMIDFKGEKSKSPFDDMNEFYDIMKKSISFDVSKSQFGGKIRGLKKKYFGKEKKRIVETSHDKKCLELGNFIWGTNGIASVKKSKKKNVVSKVVVVKEEEEEEEDKRVLDFGGGSERSSWFEKSFIVRVIESFGVDEYYVKEKWSKVPVETKKMIEEKWKLIQAKEIELFVQKTDLLKEVSSLISEST